MAAFRRWVLALGLGIVFAGGDCSLTWGDEKKAVTAVEKLGGGVRFDKDDPKKPWSVGLQGVELADADMERLAALASIKVLVLKRAVFKDKGLQVISRLKSLEVLDLMDTSIGDDGLKHLEGLTRLKTLDLGLNPKLTDAGLKHLKPLRELDYLNLAASKVTDEGLKGLEGLKKLKHVNLSGTKVTKMGVRQLELALPDVGVISTARE